MDGCAGTGEVRADDFRVRRAIDAEAFLFRAWFLHYGQAQFVSLGTRPYNAKFSIAGDRMPSGAQDADSSL